MGMDYQYAGSATYSRFWKERTEVMHLAGISETYLHGSKGYVYRNGTPKEVLEFFKDIYKYRDEKFMKIVKNWLFSEIKREDFEKASHQILYELESGEDWYINE